MTHTYNITGMTCSGCAEKVKSLLENIDGVNSANVNELTGTATIDMKNHIDLSEFQNALAPLKKYQITENQSNFSHSMTAMTDSESKSWFETYKPLLIIFAFITGLSLFAAYQKGQIDFHVFMNRFMAGFFITFSFFKFLDLKGFAESYSSYDLLAKKVPTYGYVYPFIELLLGIAYLTDFNSLITNIATIVVMGFSSIGVIQSVLDKRKIKCACLGTVFNLPMSTVTIIEDLLMVAMAGITLILQ